MENRPNPKEIRIRNTKIHFERRSISPSLSLSNTGKIGCSDTLSESSSLSGSAGTGSHASAARMASWRQRSCGTSPTIRRWDVVVVLSCWVGVGPWFSMGWDYSNGEREFLLCQKSAWWWVSTCLAVCWRLVNGSWTWSLDHSCLDRQISSLSAASCDMAKKRWEEHVHWPL